MSKSSPDLSLHTGAKGGGQLGRTRDFLKEPDEFRNPDEGKRQSRDVVGVLADEDQNYAKSGSSTPQNKRTGDKSLKAIKPR